MPNKQFLLDGDLPINIYKRKGSRNLRLSVNADGDVRVSIPAWAPYSAGLNFARSRRDWIAAQRTTPLLLVHGQPIGKAHHLQFQPKAALSQPTSRLLSSAVIVSHPPTLTADDPTVQKAARDGSIRALRVQAERLLPQRLATLADLHGFSYSGVTVRQLKSRWGSCDQNRHIVLNLFLMQLPWEYIDYVLLHELTHTKIMRHGPDFWQAMTALQPDAKSLRRRLRTYQPTLNGSPEPAVA